MCLHSLFTSVLVEQMTRRSKYFPNIQAFILITPLSEMVTYFCVAFRPDIQVTSVVGLWKSEYKPQLMKIVLGPLRVILTIVITMKCLIRTQIYNMLYLPTIF